MANLNIKFNNKPYSIPSASLADATARLEAHLTGMMEERLEGDGQEFYTLAPSTLSFRSSAPLNELKEVQINGQTVDPANYTLEEGSTIVTFPIDYLKNFGKGNYEVTVESENKTVSGGFTVVDPDLNDHGFYYNQPYVTEVEVPIEEGTSSKAAFFLREDGTVDLIFVKYALTISGTFTCEGKNATMDLGNMVLTGVWSDDGKSIYNNEMQINAVLGSTEAAADSDFMYAYNETLGGYQVSPIDRTKSYYGLIKSNINNIPTVAITDSAFSNCTSLIKIMIPNTVTTIGEYAFSGCSSLKECVISNSVTNIGNQAFRECSSLTKVNIPSSVTSIGTSAFSGCAFENITLPSGITSIEESTFSYCTSLTSIVIPDSVTRIGLHAFGRCDNLTRLTIGSNSQLTLIDERAFNNCYALSRLDLPDSLLQIGTKAFQGCNALVDVTFGNSLETIGSSAFADCTTLRAITIPDSVTEIAGDAFNGCSLLTEVVIGNSVTSMPSFGGCYAIKRIVIGNAVTELHGFDGDYYSMLEEVVIGNSITSIPDFAYSDCTSLKSVVIGDSVTNIGYEAFKGCSSLTSVYITDIEAWLNVSFNYAEAHPCNNGADLYLNGEKLTELVIPDTVTKINEYAFYNCDSLTNVTVGASVTTIGRYAFSACNSIVSIVIPDAVTSIANHAFYDCSSLTSINFEGTKEQWNAITKGYEWNHNVPATHVHCSDGDVAL